jgi:outer membrane protein TolC
MNLIYRKYSTKKSVMLTALIIMGINPSYAQDNQSEHHLTMQEAISSSIANDPWLTGNTYSQESVEALSVSVGTLPDPKVSVAMANFPTDTFNYGQEGMTQFKVGVSQMFPRGDTLAIKRNQLEVKSTQFPYQRQDRKEKIKVTVAQLWLDAYKAQESISLINKDRGLFEQLTDVAQASYSAALGRTRQQDIIRAQLELTRLDDRLTVLNQKFEMSVQKLSQWLSSYFSENYGQIENSNNLILSNKTVVDKKLPNIALMNASLYEKGKVTTANELFELLSSHPAVLSVRKKIEVTDIGIDLAKQKFKPAWGVNASYGFRGYAPNGDNRPDFLSLGVTFDVPLFTKNKQDKELESAVAQSSAVHTEEWLLLRKFIASFEMNKAQFLRLNERQALYHDILLPQMHEQAEASLTAYTNDDGDFAEVVRSRIAELNAQIDALNINVDRQKTIAQLNYFFITNNNKSQQGENK